MTDHSSAPAGQRDNHGAETVGAETPRFSELRAGTNQFTTEARLPYDVKVGGTTFRKGVALETFIEAARHWHRHAFPEGYALTDEQKAANLARLQACAAPRTEGYDPAFEEGRLP
jgi:hypothetical protein